MYHQNVRDLFIYLQLS